MKKQIVTWLLITALPLALSTACANNADDDVSTVSDSDSGAGEAAVSFSEEDYGDVTLGNYIGLEAEKTVTEVTEEDIDDEVENLLYDYVEYNELSRPSQEGDYVNMSLTASEDGEVIDDYSEDGYEICLGDEEFGAEFDEKLTGVNTGDHLTFTITYAEDDEDAYYAGSTVDYDITVEEITEEVFPELTESFIQDTLGYDSEEAMRTELAEALAEENEESSMDEVRENLLQQVIDSSTFENYSDALYESCANDIESSYLSYAEFFGYESAEEIYDLFGITEEDVEAEVLNQVYRVITIHALTEKENITLSDKEYEEGLEKYAEDYGYETGEDMVADYGEEEIRSALLEDKVMDFLAENAVITEVAESADDEEEFDVTDDEEEAEATDDEEEAEATDDEDEFEIIDGEDEVTDEEAADEEVAE